MLLSQQVSRLLILALPIACIAWTVTHEEIFREPREFCIRKSRSCRTMAKRKFYYVFTCEYCFSHYVTLLFLGLTKYQLLYSGWRGYLIGGLSLVWISNIYMSLFGLVRTGLKKEKMDADIEELKLEEARKKV